MSHSEIYGHAQLYDLAFSFKDVVGDAEAVLAMAAAAGVDQPSSFLELAAGPARDAMEFSRRGLRATAVDNSPGMIRFARDTAAQEGLDITVVEADITDFSIDRSVDIAAIYMDSLGVILDNDGLLRHLDRVADALVAGGVYIIEHGHPRDVFKVGVSAGNDWEIERDGLLLHTRWGREEDVFDPTTQIIEHTVSFTWEHLGERHEVVEIRPDRAITPNELRALVLASGRFEIVAEYGALDPAIPFSNAKDSWRYVPVLRVPDGSE